MSLADVSEASTSNLEQVSKDSVQGVQLTNKEKRLARKAEKEKAKKRKKEDDETGVVAQDDEENDGVNAEALAEDQGEDEEVEALSHKEKRKRRKLEKQGSRQDGEQAEETDAVPNAKGKQGDTTEKRSPYSLWIGNLSFNTSPQRLQEWLEESGISGISRIHMPKGARRMEYNRGFAYVDVPSAEMMQSGIGLSEGHLNGRRLLIKSGSDFGGRPSIDAAAKALAEGSMTAEDALDDSSVQAKAEDGTETLSAEARKGKTGLTKTAQKILRAQKHPAGPTLFFGNLSFNATEEIVRDMIERAASMRTERQTGNEDESKVGGEDSKPKSLRGAGIRKIRMGTFEDTGKCKGFTFVDFHTATYATATLIDARTHQLDGRALIVQYAGADAIRRGAVKGKGGHHHQTNEQGARVGYQRRSDAERQEERQRQRAILAESAPVPGSFDADAPMVKKHKETKEEREARRSKAKASGSGEQKYDGRRLKPGAALATAQRGKTGIAIDAPQVQKITFDGANDEGE